MRLRVILRGDGFLTDAGAERSGFYVVRTTLAENATLAGKLALFDFAAELQISARHAPCFHECGSLAVAEVRPLPAREQDVARGFIFYPKASRRTCFGAPPRPAPSS